MIKKFNEYHNTNESGDCNCGCGGCNKKSKIKVKSETKNISENLSYHIDNNIPLTESVFRYGSEAFFNTINEARDLYENGNIDIELSDMDQELLQTDIGKKSYYNGKEVWLDIPMVESINEATYRGKNVKVNSPKRDSSGGKAYKVYVKGCNKETESNPDGVKIVRFGSGGLKAKIDDPDARKAYDSRHGCSDGKHEDRCKAGYWSCRLPRYAKSLGLSGSGQWW